MRRLTEMTKRLILLTALISITLVGCNNDKETGSTIENSIESSVPVETATPEPTVESTATPTVEPTSTIEPTPTPTVEPTATPEPATEQPTTTQPAAEQPVTPTQGVQSQNQGESPLSDMTNQEIQDALNAAMSGNDSNTGLTTPDGRPFIDTSDQDHGGDAAENGWSGTSHNWSN